MMAIDGSAVTVHLHAAEQAGKHDDGKLEAIAREVVEIVTDAPEPLNKAAVRGQIVTRASLLTALAGPLVARRVAVSQSADRGKGRWPLLFAIVARACGSRRSAG